LYLQEPEQDAGRQSSATTMMKGGHIATAFDSMSLASTGTSATTSTAPHSLPPQRLQGLLT